MYPFSNTLLFKNIHFLKLGIHKKKIKKHIFKCYLKIRLNLEINEKYDYLSLKELTVRNRKFYKIINFLHDSSILFYLMENSIDFKF